MSSKSQDNPLIPLLERLCGVIEKNSQVVEALHQDLRPELRRTATLERMRQEQKALAEAAAEAVRRQRKDK